MIILKAQFFLRKAWRWGALLALLWVVGGGRAAETPEPNRFLLVFETSPAVKKNLPAVRQLLDGLFASNLQGEMQENDDLAVWTVDQDLHTGTFPLASWSPADAVMYSARLKDFLGRQTFSRRASLAAVQPLLNRVVKNSERLTVVIFCDGQSRLLGTPYDDGVNEIITNATVKTKTTAPLIVLVLRSYHGEYLGCSVNRSAPLNFPRFPSPPKPEPAPKPEPTPAVKPTPTPAPAVAVAPVPALIIVGTNFSTNVSVLTKPPPVPVPAPVPPPAAETNAPVTKAPGTNIAPATKAAATTTQETNAPIAKAAITRVPETNAPVTNAPTPVPKIVAAPITNPPRISNPTAPNPPALAQPAPARVPVLPETSAPNPVAIAPTIVTPTNPPAASPSNTLAAATDETDADSGSRWPMMLGGGLLAAAIALVAWLVVRARRPRGSLITSSMQDDLRLPPRK